MKKVYYWLETQKLLNIYSKDSKEMKYFQLQIILLCKICRFYVNK